MFYSQCILLLLASHILFAQGGQHGLTFYTTKEGLSNNTVYCIKQDSRGFLWIGTQEGLSRFDGSRFKNFFTEKNNSNSFPNDNILEIAEYRYGQLLIATGNGIGVLNTLTGKFENEKIKTAFLKAGSGTLINSIYKDKQANIWVNHSGELDLLDSNLNYLYRFTDLGWAKALKGILISLEQCYTDKHGRLWIPSDTSGLHIIDFTAKKIYNSSNNPGKLPFLKKQSIRCFFFDEEKNKLLYAPWGEGLFSYDFTTGMQRQELFGIPYRDESRTINSIIKMSPDHFLFYIGADCYEMNTGDFSYRLIPEKKIILKNNEQVANTIVLLKTGSYQYWAGTTTGLIMSDSKSSLYTELSLSKAGINNRSNCTDMILSRSGKLYCTYTNSLVIIEKNRVDTRMYSLPGKDNNILTEVCEDTSNRIWIGTQKGIYIFDTITKKIIQPGSMPSELLRVNCNALYCDNDGELWISTRNPFGLYRYNAGSNQLQKINNAVTRRFEMVGESSRISNITEDKKKNLWMTSRVGGGIICYIKSKDEWKLYPDTGVNFNLLANKAIASLYADEKGFLWIGTYTGDGLIRFDYKNNTVVQFGRNDGLQSNYIKNICGDNEGNIWLVSEYGVTGFNMEKARHHSTVSYDNFINDEQQPVFDSLNNRLILTAQNKLLLIPADHMQADKNIPAPVIDRISVNNEAFFLNVAQQPFLRHDQKNITIDFTAVQFSEKEKTVFAYKMIGIDDDWKYADANRSAQYSILAPGRYTFILKSGNESGAWNPVTEKFTFTIVPPWWQTWWFRVLFLLTLAGIIILLVRKRIESIRAGAEMKQKIAETEMQALRAQMNPHFIFNCINSIDALIQSNDKYHATVYLNKFAKLIRNILESSKQNTVPLFKDLETLKLYIDMELFRNENKFKINFATDTELLNDDYKVPPLIVQPFVENAILHGLRNKDGNEGLLSIDIKKVNGTIQYIITDNGIGRAAAGKMMQNKQSHYGMQISYDRIKLFNKEKSVSVQVNDLFKNETPAGTEVRVSLNIL